MSEATQWCKVCGHDMDEHNALGCGFSVGDDDFFCVCSATPTTGHARCGCSDCNPGFSIDPPSPALEPNR